MSLRTEGSHVILQVRDYGRGIPPAVVQSLQENGSGGGVGLAGMNERIREIGGRLEIRSSVVGTEIVARVPVQPGTMPDHVSPTMQEVKG